MRRIAPGGHDALAMDRRQTTRRGRRRGCSGSSRRNAESASIAMVPAGAPPTRAALVLHLMWMEIRRTYVALARAPRRDGGLAALRVRAAQAGIEIGGGRALRRRRRRIWDRFDIGGSLRYSHAGSGLSVDLTGRTLAAHADGDYGDCGAGASVRLDPGTDGRGLSFTVTPVWGAPRRQAARSGCGRCGTAWSPACRRRGYAPGVGYRPRARRVRRPRFDRPVRRVADIRDGPRLARGGALRARRGDGVRGRRDANGVGCRAVCPWHPVAVREDAAAAPGTRRRTSRCQKSRVAGCG